jgi:hypothetical protein
MKVRGLANVNKISIVKKKKVWDGNESLGEVLAQTKNEKPRSKENTDWYTCQK